MLNVGSAKNGIGYGPKWVNIERALVHAGAGTVWKLSKVSVG
jgi:hypothetical protein